MNDGTPLVAGAGICCVDYIVMSPNVKWGDTVHMSKYIVQGGGLVGTAIVAYDSAGGQVRHGEPAGRRSDR